MERSRFLARLAPPAPSLKLPADSEGRRPSKAKFWCDAAGDRKTYVHECDPDRWQPPAADSEDSEDDVDALALAAAQHHITGGRQFMAAASDRSGVSSRRGASRGVSTCGGGQGSSPTACSSHHESRPLQAAPADPRPRRPADSAASKGKW